jgi:hypothetical protein
MSRAPGAAQTAVELTGTEAAQAAVEQTRPGTSQAAIEETDVQRQHRLLYVEQTMSKGWCRTDTFTDSRTDSSRDKFLNLDGRRPSSIFGFHLVFRFVSVSFGLNKITNVLFRIVPKPVSVPVSVFSNRNYFRRTPYLDPQPLHEIFARTIL